MPRISIGHAEFYYEIHGSGDPLLLVTGLGGNASFWALQIPKFAKDFKVVVYDQRGSGRSTMSPIAYSVDQMTADVVAKLALETAAARLAHVLRLAKVRPHVGINPARLLGTRCA